MWEAPEAAGYFHTGTAGHKGFELQLDGATLADATQAAVTMLHELLAAEGDKPVRWTKKRPAEDAEQLVIEHQAQFRDAVIDPKNRIKPYDEIEPIALELTTDAGYPPVVTQIDSIWQGDNLYCIVDWKTGATAKAKPQQLWLYNYAARHTPHSPIHGLPAENVEMWYHHVAFSKIQRVNDYPGDEYMEALLAASREQRQQIHKNGFAAANPDWYCNYCLVREYCPVMGDGVLSLIADAVKAAPVEYKRPDMEDH
jgi:hypothetical protein